jgi:hypothetical protein
MATLVWGARGLVSSSCPLGGPACETDRLKALPRQRTSTSCVMLLRTAQLAAPPRGDGAGLGPAPAYVRRARFLGAVRRDADFLTTGRLRGALRLGARREAAEEGLTTGEGTMAGGIVATSKVAPGRCLQRSTAMAQIATTALRA